MGNKHSSGEAGTGEGKAELGSCVSSITQTRRTVARGATFQKEKCSLSSVPKKKNLSSLKTRMNLTPNFATINWNIYICVGLSKKKKEI